MTPNRREANESTQLLLENSTRRLSELFEKPGAADDGDGAEVLVPVKLQSNTFENDFQDEEDACNCTQQDVKSTLTGSVVFLLYHVVFCLAQASTITRPHSNHSSTCVMAKTAALGVFIAGPLFVWELGDRIPAIYPASDLFLAPFLAQLATTIDEVLYQRGLENDDSVFLATFGVVMGIGLIVSGLLCILAARVKLANLGAFLPYSVLCGFFTTIGILIWTLGFSVDVGQKIGDVLLSGSGSVMANALLHHTPSLIIGIIMHIFGPKNPLLVVLLVVCTILGSFVVLWVTGTSLERAQELKWFFSPAELQGATIGPDSSYGSSAPFGIWLLASKGYVCWDACKASLPTMLSLVFLYLVRCSLHSAALKKNIPNVTRDKKEEVSPKFISPTFRTSSSHRSSKPENKKSVSIDFILEHGYGYTQIASGLVGGITVAPSVAASLTLFKLGAESNPPQYGSFLLVIIFYLTNFSLVQYIPKAAFSCLMVLAGLDMCRTWIFDSYFKTKAKAEWIVGPLLVILAFSIGVLNAIFCGVACSTFIFVAKFYSAGAVKFVGNSLTLRSTVERGLKETEWLDQNGDLIQILVVQNYLFFGNSQSLLSYITTMFEDIDRLDDVSRQVVLPPIPKYLIIEFTLVTGMDTSAVDNIREILRICQSHKCKLFLAGLHPPLRSALMYAGIKTTGNTGKNKYLAYTSDMESALAKAEDGLLSKVFHLEEKNEAEASNRKKERRMSESEDDGFVYALKKIDELHGLHTAEELKEFQVFSQPLDLEPGDVLVRDSDKGLYFVETGLMRVQWSPGNTTRNFANLTLKGPKTQQYTTDEAGINALASNDNSIGHLNARSQTIGREAAIWKLTHASSEHASQSFRLARIGQGWIIGGIEIANGMKKPGVHVAVTSCRLHHLPGSSILQVENENPKLAMCLYKMISHLATKRQEMTISQLGQQIRILNNPVPRLKGQGRAALAQIRDAGFQEYNHALA